MPYSKKAVSKATGQTVSKATSKTLSSATSVAGALLLFFSAQPASAAVETGPYVGAYYGGYKSRGGDFEDENDLYELSAGYRILPYFGVELGYTNLGEFGGDLASAEVDGFSLSATGFLPLSDSATFYGEVGQFRSTTDVEVLGFNDEYDDETVFFGLGMSFRISDPLWLNAEYQRYKVDVDTQNWPVEVDDEDTDIDALKVGLTFNF